MPTLQEKIEAFFVTFPGGAGEQWMAAFFGATRVQIAEACTAIGLERVEMRSKSVNTSAKPDDEALVEIGIEWRCWTT